MNPFDLVPGWLRIALVSALIAGAVLALKAWQASLREEGRAEVRAECTAERERLKDAALRESQAKAKETLRRIEAQERNQHAKDQALAAALAAADRAERVADRLRHDNAAAAREWAARLADSPTAGDLAAASAALGVCTDLLGRADRRAGILAAYADAARTAGEGCSADYDALRRP